MWKTKLSSVNISVHVKLLYRIDLILLMIMLLRFVERYRPNGRKYQLFATSFYCCTETVRSKQGDKRNRCMVSEHN